MGELAMPDFCPRCFWIKVRLGNRLPFQMFPGIFSSTDSYTKSVVHGFVHRHGTFPSWLSELGELKGYKPPPRYTRFRVLDKKNDIVLTGVPDGIFVKADGSHLIVDYKTARFTATQDSLLPIYKVQLNSYALIGEGCGFKPVSGLALIYMEPTTGADAAASDLNRRDDGFAMGFTAHIQTVDLDHSIVYPLLAKVRDTYDSEGPPHGHGGCDDCQAMEKLAELL